jgi:hypothetical protein
MTAAPRIPRAKVTNRHTFPCLSDARFGLDRDCDLGLISTGPRTHSQMLTRSISSSSYSQSHSCGACVFEAATLRVETPGGERAHAAGSGLIRVIAGASLKSEEQKQSRARSAEVRNQADSCLLLALRRQRRQRHLHTKSSGYKHLRKESVAAGGHVTQSGTAETLRLAIRSSVMAIKARRLRLWAEDCPDSAGFSGTHVPDGAA